MIQTNDRFPSVSSQNKDVIVNKDGSVDVYFGPKPPAGKKPNWVQTIPGQTWFTILRLYGPLEPWFKRTWQPGEIELVDAPMAKGGLIQGIEKMGEKLKAAIE